MRELKTEKDLLLYNFLLYKEEFTLLPTIKNISLYKKLKEIVPDIQFEVGSGNFSTISVGNIKSDVSINIKNGYLYDKVYLSIHSGDDSNIFSYIGKTKVFELKWKEVKEFFDLLKKESHLMYDIYQNSKSKSIKSDEYSKSFKMFKLVTFTKSEIDKIINLRNLYISNKNYTGYINGMPSIIKNSLSSLIIEPKLTFFNPKIELFKREDDWFLCELSLYKKFYTFLFKIDGFDELYSMLKEFNSMLK